MSAIELLYRAALGTPATRTLIINAQAHELLTALNEQAQLELWQQFKPGYDALKGMGMAVSPALPSAGTPYDLILLLPAKNKQQTLAWMATAMQQLTDQGRLLVACANNHGAKSYEDALKKLAGKISSSSKSKCRIFSARKTAALDGHLATQWLNAGKQQRVESHGLISQPGLFSWDRPDRGSLLLLEQLPELSGTGVDLCCGYGLLSEKILRSSKQVDRLHLVEADHLALDCAAMNCTAWSDKTEYHWLDAASQPLPENMAWIACNPPFHTGQDRDIDLGQQIIINACRALKPGGLLYLVANRKLPYEAVLQSGLKTSQTLIEAEGFKVIRGIR
ncbi:class I SAM-dependent methyltransferase [Mariprofundus aestuarium]|nr:methyltransferase [Mariprofundus aestuarium]